MNVTWRATHANLCYTGEGDDPVSERDFVHNRPPPERGFTSPGTWYAEEGDSEYKQRVLTRYIHPKFGITVKINF